MSRTRLSICVHNSPGGHDRRAVLLARVVYTDDESPNLDLAGLQGQRRDHAPLASGNRKWSEAASTSRTSRRARFAGVVTGQ